MVFKGRPFKVDVQKVRLAFEWLKEHNPYYKDIVWESSAEAAWLDETEAVGQTRDEDILEDAPAASTEDDFQKWLEEGETHRDSGIHGFVMAPVARWQAGRRSEEPLVGTSMRLWR